MLSMRVFCSSTTVGLYGKCRLMTSRRNLCAKRTHSSHSTNSARKVVSITTFNDLATPTKRFILRVHPDIVHSYGQEATTTNQASLQEFFRLFDSLRTKCEAAESEAAIRATPLTQRMRSRYQLSFFYKQSTGPEQVTVQHANVDIAVPTTFEDRISCVQLLSSKGLHKQAHAHVLHLATDSLAKLLQAVHIDTELKLDDNLKQIVEAAAETSAKKRRQAADADAFAGAVDALHMNLSHESPLVQGKRSRQPLFSSDSDTGVFSLKQRRDRAYWLLSRSSNVSTSSTLSREQCRLGMQHLAALLIRWHDAIQLYDTMWDAIRLHLSHALYADVENAYMHIPYNVSDEEFLAFLQQYLPAMRTVLRQKVARKTALGNRIK